MADDFVIFVNGSRLENWTDASLSRSKSELTGSLNFSLFLGYMPGAPVMVDAICGAEIVVYIGGNLAFVGSIDRRRGSGNKHGKEGTKVDDNSIPGGNESGLTGSVSIGPDEYTVKVTCRGKTKILIDSAHRHPTTNILRPTTQDVVNTLMEGTGVEVEWMAEPQKLDKVRFRDGATVQEELNRVGNENAHFMYETREGKLRVTDDTGRTIGDPLILGENILTFSAEQSEDDDRAEIQVKGQRTPNESWGEDAVIPTSKIISNSNTTNKAIANIQHYGDATPEALDRRANFEANKRNASSKEASIEVFGVQSDTAPWDIGNVHYVEIPPEGIFTPMECTALEYSVDANKTLKTKLTLSPMPAGGVAGGSGGFGFALTGLEDLLDIGLSRKAQSRASTFNVSWGGPVLAVIDPVKSLFAFNLLDPFKGLDDEDEEKKPDKLPPAFNEHT